MKRIKDFVLNVALFILICMTVIMVGSKIITGKSSFFGYRPFVVQSESMLPDYKIGTLLIAQVTDEVEIGEIYAYKDVLGRMIVHRLVEITDEGYIFKGDNNDFTDRPVGIERIYYKIIKSY